MKPLFSTRWLLPALFFFAPAMAQVPDSSRQWSLDECFRYATEHNIQVSNLRLDQQASRQDLYAAKGTRIPSLSASVSQNFSDANATRSDGSLANQFSASGNYSLASSILLWNDNSVNNTIRQRELQAQMADLSVQQSLNNITLQITAAYLDILLARENLSYIKDLVVTSEARVKQGEQLYAAGSIARKDLLQLQAQLASDRYLLVQSENTIRQRTLSLRQLLQLPPDSLFDIKTPPVLQPESALPLLGDAREAALRNFPEIKLGKLGVDYANLSIAKAKAAFKPTLSASGSVGTGYNAVIINSLTAKPGYFTQNRNNLSERIGLTLAVPIFSNRTNKTNLARAEIAGKQAELNWQNDRLVLSQTVEQAWLSAQNAMKSYDAAGVQLEAATESYRISNEQFRLGSINLYDLQLQRNQYIQAVQAYVQARYTAVMQQKIYRFYTGQPVTL